MKRAGFRILLIAMLLFAMALAPAYARALEPATGITLNFTTKTITVGTAFTLVPTVTPAGANQTVTFKSSSPRVAIVYANGWVPAIAAGTTTVTATTADGRHSASCVVTVLPRPVLVQSVSLSPSKLSLTVGKMTTLTPTVLPANASNLRVTYKSSSPRVALIYPDGRLYALTPGTVTITATSAQNGRFGTCEVTVLPRPVPAASITLDKTSLALQVGTSYTLRHTILPANTTDKSVKFRSSNTDVALVYPDGKVLARGVGTTTITATALYGNKSTTCAVTVGPKIIPVSSVTLNNTALSLAIGKTFQLSATVSPSTATDKAVTFASSDTGVARVSGTGLITAVEPGTAKITATAGGKTATCTVTVPTPAAKYRALLIAEQTYTGEETMKAVVAKYNVGGLKAALSNMSNGYTITTKIDRTRNQILADIKTAFAGATEYDVSVFYLNCHGWGDGYYTEFSLYQNTWLTSYELKQALQAVPGKVVLMLDTCYSGGVISKDGEASAPAVDPAAAIIRTFSTNDGLVEKNGEFLTDKYYVLVSSSMYELSWYYYNGSRGQGLFTESVCLGAGYNIVQGTNVKPAADSNSDKTITLNELYRYTRDRVYSVTSRDSQAEPQNVQVYPVNSNFSFMKLK